MTIRQFAMKGNLLLPERFQDPENTIFLRPMETKVGGFWRVQLRRRSGSLKYDTGWFKNLITDQGMDFYGNSTGFVDTNGFGGAPTWCCVGTGTSAPSVSDTALVAPLAVRGFSVATIPSYVAGPPAYNFQSCFWAFPLGSVIGNISEIGAGPLATGAGTNLARFRCYTRQLILDSLGNPTTISVTSGDQLNTSYQLRLYFDLSDATTSIAISGPGGGTFGGTIRRSKTSSFGTTGVMGILATSPYWGNTTAALWTGTIGTTSSNPGGASLGMTSATYGTYTPGSFTKTVDSFWNTTNLGTVNSIQLGSTALGFWQANMAPGFVKSGSNTLHINWSMAWARF